MEAKLSKECYKAFIEFKLKDRVITLCAKKNGSYICVGMSVCNPEDTFDPKLGRRIAEGRASNQYRKSGRLFIEDCYLGENDHKFGIYKALLKITKEKIKLNPENYIATLKNKKK